MDQNNMRGENEELNAAAPEEISEPDNTAEETVQQPQSSESAPAAEDAAQTPDAEAAPKQPKKDIKLTVALAAVIALLAVAAIFVASKIKNNAAQDAHGSTLTEQESVSGPVTIAHENAAGFTSYTMTEEQATPAVLDQQVAVCGEWTLTNRELAYYFWQQYSNMYQQYGQMLLYILQGGVGLDEQALPDDPSTTWQQAFLDSAVSNFGLIAAVVQDAEKNGFVLGEELQSQVDSMRDTLESTAVGYGYANADAFLQELYGASANLEDYLAFVQNLSLIHI